MLLTGVGAAIGVAGALVLTRLIASLLYGVTPTDPLTYAGMSVLVIMVGLAGVLAPSRRATAVDPTQALRAE